MKKYFTILLVTANICYSQNEVTIKIVEDSSRNPVNNIIVELLNTEHRTATDSNGMAIFSDVADGYYTFRASWVGYNIYTENIDIIALKKNYFEFKIQKTKHIKVEY